MKKITTMKELLNERLSEEDIIKLVSNYDNKFNELEKENKEQQKEIERLNNIINESAEEILKELEENHHLSYGVALAIRQKLLDYKELKGEKQ